MLESPEAHRSRGHDVTRGLRPGLARGLLSVLILAVFVGCADRPAPAGSLEVSPGTIELPYPGTAEVTLRFTSLAGDGGEALPGPGGTVFLHLVNEAGEILRTFDHALPEAPRSGEEIAYPVRLYQSALAPTVPPGTYRLIAGLVDADGERRALEGPATDLGRGEYQVATVTVPDDGPGAPELLFEGEWEEPESGSDRQILARRWLMGPGRFAVRGAAPEARLWVRLRLPPLGDPGSRLVLLDPTESARLRVSSSCGALDRILEGGAPLDLEIPLDAPTRDAETAAADPTDSEAVEVPEDSSGTEGPEPCWIDLDPSFYLVKEGSFERRVASLELVSLLTDRP